MRNITISAQTHTLNSSAISIALSTMIVSASSVYWKTCPALIGLIANRSINTFLFPLFDKNKYFLQSRSMNDVNLIALDCMGLHFLWQWSGEVAIKNDVNAFSHAINMFHVRASVDEKVLPICHCNLWSSIPPLTTFFQFSLLMSGMTSWMVYCSAMSLRSSFFFEFLMNLALLKRDIGYWASSNFKASFWS